MNRKMVQNRKVKELPISGATVETKPKKKICVVLVDRANYGRLKPVLLEITERPELQLQLVAAGTMVLERFGHPVQNVKNDGFTVDGEIYIELEGSTPATMAKSLGFAVVEFSSEFQRLKPDVVMLIGDRYEALAAALAAAYMNICIVHIQGGEVSGSIDESARHAITKLAHYHFPSTERSAEYLVRMGESPESILGVGCPSSDIARLLVPSINSEMVNATGSGATIDIEKPFLLVVFHPTTTTYGGERKQVEEILQALSKMQMQTLMLWPNIDAGADHISKAIRLFRDREAPNWLRTITNLSPEHYLNLLARVSCAVGNSSSFVRDAGYFGTPVVLVGDRQEGRETDEHVTHVVPIAAHILRAIQNQVGHGSYAPSTLYGDGLVSRRIADGLVKLTPYVQKRLHYIYDQDTEDQNGDARTWNHNRPRRVERHPSEERRVVAR
jgi:UDP-hydrolysing UDP-N-acetyl-D-glucosamine 2-epimerase